MALSPVHHSAVTWAALPPGKSIFGSSRGSRAWPRLHAKHPHFLLLTASLLYHKLSPFIFFSTRKCCSHWAPTLPRATGPPGSNPSPETLAFCSLHKTHRGFLKPISPCHQTVVFLTEQEKKILSFLWLRISLSHLLAQPSSTGTTRRRMTASRMLAQPQLSAWWDMP